MGGSVAWTHNTLAACIIHVEDVFNDESVVNAQHTNRGRSSVRFSRPATGQTHAERRLHQVMMIDKDYEESTYGQGRKPHHIVVTVEHCQEKDLIFADSTSSQDVIKAAKYYKLFHIQMPETDNIHGNIAGANESVQISEPWNVTAIKVTIRW
ncbi:hypothetical protein CTI12_AA577560 [Artemisia annua]|uniref:Uncharacterized protein n=1 Tax=Artemisia annua TaxID=35608 RepID=A0A2U1KQ28_ARTAN|nr:hypothetical protein CTI12_AA577560 [Artemisia annua]